MGMLSFMPRFLNLGPNFHAADLHFSRHPLRIRDMFTYQVHTRSSIAVYAADEVPLRSKWFHKKVFGPLAYDKHRGTVFLNEVRAQGMGKVRIWQQSWSLITGKSCLGHIYSSQVMAVTMTVFEAKKFLHFPVDLSCLRASLTYYSLSLGLEGSQTLEVSRLQSWSCMHTLN